MTEQITEQKNNVLLITPVPTTRGFYPPVVVNKTRLTPDGGVGAHDPIWCTHVQYNYDPTVALLCAVMLVFGVVYTIYGYRCFKAVMFLTGFLFGSAIVYLICQEEHLLPAYGNLGVSLGGGILFGLITMLVQYVGLFITGFHTGLLLGVIGIVLAQMRYRFSTEWITVGILIGTGLLFAVTTLQFQKCLTIIGTSLYGGAMIALCLDYFLEDFVGLRWMWNRLKLTPVAAECWVTWIVLGSWPTMILLGILVQYLATGRGIYHEQLFSQMKTRQSTSGAASGHQNNYANKSKHYQQRHAGKGEKDPLSPGDVRQRHYRYLYQVRTAHGDVITQSYIQCLQRKACAVPLAVEESTSANTTLQSDRTQLTASSSVAVSGPFSSFGRQCRPSASGLSDPLSAGRGLIETTDMEPSISNMNTLTA